jgi:hypothetical protein
LRRLFVSDIKKKKGKTCADELIKTNKERRILKLKILINLLSNTNSNIYINIHRNLDTSTTLTIITYNTNTEPNIT